MKFIPHINYKYTIVQFFVCGLISDYIQLLDAEEALKVE